MYSAGDETFLYTLEGVDESQFTEADRLGSEHNHNEATVQRLLALARRGRKE